MMSVCLVLDVEPQQDVCLLSMGENLQQQPHNGNRAPYWKNRCVTQTSAQTNRLLSSLTSSLIHLFVDYRGE